MDRSTVKMFDDEKVFDSRIDTFRASALHYQEFGKYTNAVPNGHPNSQFMKFWKEEMRRCIEGYNIGYDWIPGYFYFYLNYSPIFIVEALAEGNEEGRVEGKRFKSFPKFWDGDYYYNYTAKNIKNVLMLQGEREDKNYFGSKVVNLPREISFETSVLYTFENNKDITTITINGEDTLRNYLMLLSRSSRDRRPR